MKQPKSKKKQPKPKRMCPEQEFIHAIGRMLLMMSPQDAKSFWRELMQGFRSAFQDEK